MEDTSWNVSHNMPKILKGASLFTSQLSSKVPLLNAISSLRVSSTCAGVLKPYAVAGRQAKAPIALSKRRHWMLPAVGGV